MQSHHHLPFEQPFELWREDGLLRFVLAPGARVEVRHMKEFIRLVAALDRSGKAPVVMEFNAQASVADDARALLRRVCGAHGHPVALLAADAPGRAQAELFRHVERPAFPFRVFDSRAAAEQWAMERRPMVEKSVAEAPDR
ncbi:MAG: hypothetical protein KF797_02820 [Flavobacteriales bacterium]|nr:hypothetical protein [Flavobacteriales bacterium]